MLRIKTTPVDVICKLFCSLWFLFVCGFIAGNFMLVHDHQWVNLWTKRTQQNCNHFSVFFLNKIFESTFPNESNSKHPVQLSTKFYASNTNYQLTIYLSDFIGSIHVWFNQIINKKVSTIEETRLVEMNIICLDHNKWMIGKNAKRSMKVNWWVLLNSSDFNKA